MNSKTIIGVILMIIGVVLFVFSNSISEKVAEGRGEISSAQSKVDMGNSIFSMNPTAKEMGAPTPVLHKIGSMQGLKRPITMNGWLPG